MYELVYEYLLLAALVGAELAASGGVVTEAGFALRNAAIEAEADCLRAGLGGAAGIRFEMPGSVWD